MVLDSDGIGMGCFNKLVIGKIVNLFYVKGSEVDISSKKEIKYVS